MRKRNYRAAAIVCALAATSAIVLFAVRPSPQAVGQGADPKSSSTADADIRKANSDYADAMMAADLDKIMSYWASDADYVDEAGAVTKGSEKIAALFKKVLPDLKGTKVAVRVHSLKFLRPEICLEDGTVERTMATGIKDSNRFAIVWTKTGDKWLITSVRDLPSEINDLPSVAAAQLKDLEWLVGEWADDSPKVEVALQVKWATNKAFLLMDYVIKREGADPLEVSVRVGWDGHNNRIRSWIFDSTGGFAEGYWRKDGKRWQIGTSGILPDGGVGGSTNIYEFVDANTFVWKATDRDVDGQPLSDAEMKFVRKNAKK